jgi:hypothetical protein
MSRDFVAEALAPRIVDEESPSLPSGPDDYGSSSLAQDAIEQSAQAAKFFPVAIDDIEITREPAWLIDRLLPARGLAVIVGTPKSRKSFFAADMLFAVARGADYGGRAALQGPVFYLTGEGVTGFKRRAVAMRRHYGCEGHGVPFLMIERVPDLGSDQTDVGQLLADLDRFIIANNLPVPAAIALDTLARCMGSGDENAAKDMGRFVQRCGLIEHHFGCVVVAVHHFGKDQAKGGRGSNALNGAADVTFSIEKSDAFSTVRIEEMKDGPEGQEWRFRLEPFDLSETFDPPSETSTETTTCVVELLSEPSTPQQFSKHPPKAPKGVNGDLLKVIRRAVDEAGEAAASAPPDTRAVKRETLKKYCETLAWQDPQMKPDAFRAAFSRGLSAPRDAGLTGHDKDFVWLT